MNAFKNMKQILFYSVLLSSSVNAASIFSSGDSIYINGDIIKGDYARFLSAARHIRDGHGKVYLRSPGGSFDEGFKISEEIAIRKFSTIVPNNSICFSMCAIIWSSGNAKFAHDYLWLGEDPPRNYSVIGFHNVYNGMTKQASGSGNAKLGALLANLGYGYKAIEYFTEANAHYFNFLDRNIASYLDIKYGDLSDLIEVEKQKTFPKNFTSKQEYSPIEITSLFYQALSQADGNLAASYVIPEKRGKKAFNEVNIANFYSSLKEPLSIESISQIDSSNVEVKYTYVAGKRRCNGKASVEVTYRNGYTFIKKILANC